VVAQVMKINIQKLQEDFIQTKPSEGIDSVKVSEFMESVYKESSAQSLNDNLDNLEVVQ